MEAPVGIQVAAEKLAQAARAHERAEAALLEARIALNEAVCDALKPPSTGGPTTSE